MFLDTLKEKYTELAVEKFVGEFQQMVEQDKLMPLVVSEPDEFLHLIKANRLDGTSLFLLLTSIPSVSLTYSSCSSAGPSWGWNEQ